VLPSPTPPCLEAFWDSCFDLEIHLQRFLQLDQATFHQQLQSRRHLVTEIGQHFDWAMVSDFYRNQVGSAYLFELSAWHLESRQYIGDTLRLLSDHAQGRVLDFGCGIGTHAIAAARCSQVEQVVCVDLSPTNLEFVRYRAEQLGLTKKMVYTDALEADDQFDTILCFDVLEHLPDPKAQLLRFHQSLNGTGKIVLNWYFFKGFNQEYPFHLDAPQSVSAFFQTLQTHFLEVFHPYLITARCYHKVMKASTDH
jgi:2-polyprenyl-3-methyl-5-hydroxy-6-metoxy-1,4-benzoquinol methylase